MSHVCVPDHTGSCGPARSSRIRLSTRRGWSGPNSTSFVTKTRDSRNLHRCELLRRPAFPETCPSLVFWRLIAACGCLVDGEVEVTVGGERLGFLGKRTVTNFHCLPLCFRCLSVPKTVTVLNRQIGLLRRGPDDRAGDRQGREQPAGCSPNTPNQHISLGVLYALVY